MVSGNSNQIFISWTLLLLATSASLVHGHKGTRVGFYSTTCPQAESIVSSTVQSHFNSDHTVAAGLLRMHFHDCFMRGCDASVLIDGPNTQKKAEANLGLRIWSYWWCQDSAWSCMSWRCFLCWYSCPCCPWFCCFGNYFIEKVTSKLVRRSIPPINYVMINKITYHFNHMTFLMNHVALFKLVNCYISCHVIA